MPIKSNISVYDRVWHRNAETQKQNKTKTNRQSRARERNVLQVAQGGTEKLKNEEAEEKTGTLRSFPRPRPPGTVHRCSKKDTKITSEKGQNETRRTQKTAPLIPVPTFPSLRASKSRSLVRYSRSLLCFGLCLRGQAQNARTAFGEQAAGMAPGRYYYCPPYYVSAYEICWRRGTRAI